MIVFLTWGILYCVHQLMNFPSCRRLRERQGSSHGLSLVRYLGVFWSMACRIAASPPWCQQRWGAIITTSLYSNTHIYTHKINIYYYKLKAVLREEEHFSYFTSLSPCPKSNRGLIRTSFTSTPELSSNSISKYDYSYA